MATILVVDDEVSFRTAIATLLRKAGHVVVTASNGLEGVRLFRSTSGHFDLILTDLRMPAMDGHQFVKLVRETSSRAKIICMSSAIDEPIPANTEFLPKPIDLNDLYERVDELLRRNGSH